MRTGPLSGDGVVSQRPTGKDTSVHTTDHATAGTVVTPRAADPPWTVHVAAVILTLVGAVGSFGATYFSFHDDPSRPAAAPDPGSWQSMAFLLVYLTYSLTALSVVPGLYRRSHLAWMLGLGYAASMVLFSSLKVFGLGEDAAWLFLVLDCLIGAALLARPTRRYLGS
jgi:lysylphosphatidylglycerol synthetase-like protein (DUF2156 family)